MFPEGLNITWSLRAEQLSLYLTAISGFWWLFWTFSVFCSSPPPPPTPFQSLPTLLPQGKKVVRLERITCFSAAMSLRFHPQPSDVIVSLRQSSHLHGGSSASPAQGREIGPQQKAKCAFNLNNPFNLSSIMYDQPGLLILLQFEESSKELFLFYLQRFSLLSNLTYTHKKIHVLISAHKHALLLRNKFISPTVIQIFKEKLLFFYIFSDSAELCTPFRWHLRSEVTNLGIKLKKTRCLFKDQSLSYRNLPTVWA